MPHPTNPLPPVIDRIVALLGGEGNGSRTRAAERLGVSRQVLYAWCKRGYVPPERAVEVASLTAPEIDALQILAESNAKKRKRSQRRPA